MDKDKKAVLVPLIFFKRYHRGLDIRELRRYSWQTELSEKRIKEITASISRLNYRTDKVWLDKKESDLLEQDKWVVVFWRKVKKWRWIFSNVPFLSRVFVSNTLAFGVVNKESDIDLFLIGKPKRLWTMRAFLLLELNLFELRVRSKKRRARFSPEFFVSEAALNLSPLLLDNDYYFSFWLSDLVSVWPDNNNGKLWAYNNWNKSNLPIAWRSPKQKSFVPIKASAFVRFVERILSGRMGDKLEQWLKIKQIQIILHTNERLGVNPSIIMTDEVIKLHFNDRRMKINTEIEQALKEFEEVKVGVW